MPPPLFDAQELRQSLQPVLATFSQTGKDINVVGARSRSCQAPRLDAPLDHSQEPVSLPFHTGPLWPLPQFHRRLLVHPVGRDRRRTVFA